MGGETNGLLYGLNNCLQRLINLRMYASNKATKHIKKKTKSLLQFCDYCEFSSQSSYNLNIYRLIHSTIFCILSSQNYKKSIMQTFMHGWIYRTSLISSLILCWKLCLIFRQLSFLFVDSKYLFLYQNIFWHFYVIDYFKESKI